MNVDLSNIDENPFRACSDLRKAFLPQKIKNGHGYIRISAKGTFTLCDYNSGLYWIKVSTLRDYNIDNSEISYYVLLTIGNLDDGSWQAWSKRMTKEKCDALVDRLNTEILQDLNTLPTEKELNDILKNFGLFGEFQG